MSLAINLHRPVMLLISLLLALSLMLPGPGIAISAPEPPVRLSPSDGAIIDPTTSPPYGVPTFQWAPVEGAKKYQVQVSSTIGFTVGTVG